jgi:hypothetical protein
MFNSVALPNMTGASLVFSNLQFADLGLYSVAVSDSSATETSGEVYLAAPPRILIQPQSQQAQPGQTVVFSVTAEGIGPLDYRWRRNSRSMPGETNAMLVLPNFQATDAGNYSVTVSHQLPWGRFGTISSNAVLATQ